MGAANEKKMLLNYVGSRNVYENKGSHDKLSLEKSDIFGNMRRIFQKISDLE